MAAELVFDTIPILQRNGTILYVTPAEAPLFQDHGRFPTERDLWLAVQGELNRTFLAVMLRILPLFLFFYVYN